MSRFHGIEVYAVVQANANIMIASISWMSWVKFNLWREFGSTPNPQYR